MNSIQNPASTPRGAVEATPAQASNGPPAVPWWVSLRRGLQLASQLVIASPVRLPAKVVSAANYVSMALAIWQRLDEPPQAAAPAAGHEDVAEGRDAP